MPRKEYDYNDVIASKKERRILKLESAHDNLHKQMVDDPSLCTKENINKLNCLAMQIGIMRGYEIYHY